MDIEKALDEFTEGKRKLYFLIAPTALVSSLTSLDFAKRKSSKGLGIVCWTSQEALAAEKAVVKGLAQMRDVELSWVEFTALMDKNDPERRHFDGFNLVK